MQPFLRLSHVCVEHTSCAKTTELIKMPFGGADSWSASVCKGGSAAAMRPFAKYFGNFFVYSLTIYFDPVTDLREYEFLTVSFLRRQYLCCSCFCHVSAMGTPSSSSAAFMHVAGIHLSWPNRTQMAKLVFSRVFSINRRHHASAPSPMLPLVILSRRLILYLRRHWPMGEVRRTWRYLQNRRYWRITTPPEKDWATARDVKASRPNHSASASLFLASASWHLAS